MITTDELIIRGERAQLDRLLTRVEGLLRDGWKRDIEVEDRLAQHLGRAPWTRCFTCTAKADRPAAALWIHARSASELYVDNVIALGARKWSDGEPDRVLREFEREILRPAADKLDVTVEFVPRRPSFEYGLSPEAVRLLRLFSAAANRANLDAKDRQRWNAFLVRVHQDESLLDPAGLDEWLRQEGWPDPARRQLVSEYETAQSLLLAYDDQCARR